MMPFWAYMFEGLPKWDWFRKLMGPGAHRDLRESKTSPMVILLRRMQFDVFLFFG